MNDDQIVGRDHEGILALSADGSKRAGRNIDRRRSSHIARKSNPPQISVAQARAQLGKRSRVGLRALADPRTRNDLAAVPRSLMEIKQCKPGKVARTHANGIGRMLGGRAAKIFTVARLVVLHPDGSRDALLERGEDRLSGGALVNRPERVEVPVVVVPEGSGRMTATQGTSPGHACGFIQRG